MTVHLVTFATSDMEQSSWLCATSSKQYGVKTHARFNEHNLIHVTGAKENLDFFKGNPRGYGYWLWKSMVIAQELAWLAEGDILIYADAGIEFIGNVYHVIDRMDVYGKPQNDIWLFGNNWEHAHWCKRDVVEMVWPQPWDFKSLSWQGYGKQVQASVIFFRVSDYARRFVKEWLDWCLFEGGRLIDDSPSRTPNHPEFREHRHDQAILTTMAYRDGIKLHWWPASYNDGAFVYDKLPVYAKDDYPVLFNHHRRRNHEWIKCA